MIGTLLRGSANERGDGRMFRLAAAISGPADHADPGYMIGFG